MIETASYVALEQLARQSGKPAAWVFWRPADGRCAVVQTEHCWPALRERLCEVFGLESPNELKKNSFTTYEEMERQAVADGADCVALVATDGQVFFTDLCPSSVQTALGAALEIQIFQEVRPQ
jgi:hypothetical protein